MRWGPNRKVKGSMSNTHLTIGDDGEDVTTFGNDPSDWPAAADIPDPTPASTPDNFINRWTAATNEQRAAINKAMPWETRPVNRNIPGPIPAGRGIPEAIVRTLQRRIMNDRVRAILNRRPAPDTAAPAVEPIQTGREHRSRSVRRVSRTTAGKDGPPVPPAPPWTIERVIEVDEPFGWTFPYGAAL